MTANRERLSPQERAVYDYIKQSFPRHVSVREVFMNCWPEQKRAMISRYKPSVRTTVANIRKKLDYSEEIVTPTHGCKGTGFHFRYNIPQEEFL